MPYVCSSVHPPRDERPFSAVVCIKVSLCNNIALGTISIHCQILLVISLLTIFLVAVPLQHFGFFLFFSCPGSQGSVFFKASTFQRRSCIQMTHLAEPKTTFKASVMWTRRTCHFTKFNLTWSANSCTSHHAAPTRLWRFSVSGRLCLPASSSLAGVNGASFCLVQHPCYFDVMAIPLPDQ